ncbi:MAG: hypothetical protein ACHQE6_03815 [Solirubrobacterales bacterium]
MLSNPLRAALLAGVLSLLALIGGPIASAGATVESSQITSPASPTYSLFDETLPPHQHAFTVSGTTIGSGNVALRCYYGIGPKEFALIAKEVVPSGNTFSVEVESESLYTGPCVLRAVPVNDEAAHPPGTASEEAGDPFKGPRVAGSTFELFTSNKTIYDYELELNTLSGYLDIESAGDCGLDYSNLFAQDSLAKSEHLFYCNGALYKEYPVPSGKATRSELQIDGANAYSPTTAHYVANKIEEVTKETIPGAPQVTATQHFDPATGLVTIHEVDPIVECSPAPAVFPATAASCKEYISTGVQLERTWQTSNANQVALMADNWSSTDGSAHALNAIYDQALVTESKEGGTYEFPGSSAFAATTKGHPVTLPPSAGTIYYKEDAATPAGGDGKHPQGAIVYDRPPSEPLAVYAGSNEKNSYNEFEMPYQGAIPATGAYTLRMAFVQGYGLPEVETLAGEAFASHHPTLAITSPANGTTVSTSSVTVSGTTSDTGATPSLTVDGHAVSVGAGGAWSTSVALSKGTNTITAVATNDLGLTTEKSVSVTYTPPAPPVAHASQVGSANGANGQARFTVACTGVAGSSCEIEATLTTVEKFRHGRLVAVSARRHHPRTRSQRIVVGSSKLTIPAGQRVTIAIQLNSVGKSLLARFGRLPVHLTVVQISATRRSTVIVQNLTVKPHHRARHKHHHHRH